jgi:hypothetical protein
MVSLIVSKQILPTVLDLILDLSQENARSITKEASGGLLSFGKNRGSPAAIYSLALANRVSLCSRSRWSLTL